MFNGYPITYDEIGNPTVYTLPNCYSAQLLWSHGRQLSAVNMGGTWYYYGYNDEGVRVYKNGGAYYHNYTVDGTRVITDSWGDNILVYLYDADGAPLGMQYRNVSVTDPEQFYTYWFEKNLQGDIVAIYNESGVKLISYAYDAWGKQVRTIHNSSGANAYAQYNCLTYRGYFYDQETGLYYLNSRYYNPVTKRFINADGEMSGIGDSILGNNLFAYCHNNPVNMSDINGNWPKWIDGAINIVSGVTQMTAGAALGATVGWTGVGAVVAGFLIVNGSAVFAKGAGQIINDISNNKFFREDNIVRTGTKELGRAIGGDAGSTIAAGLYDTAVVASNIYAGKTLLQNNPSTVVNSKLFNIHDGYGIKIGQTQKQSYGYINLFYQNNSFIRDYGIRGGTFISLHNKLGDCLFRLDWDPKDGWHIQGLWVK